MLDEFIGLSYSKEVYSEIFAFVSEKGDNLEELEAVVQRAIETTSTFEYKLFADMLSFCDQDKLRQVFSRLIPYYYDDTNKRNKLISFMAKIGTFEMVDYLIELYLSGIPTAIRQVAEHALIDLNERIVFPVLENAVIHLTNKDVVKKLIDLIKKTRVKEIIRRMLAHPDLYVKRYALDLVKMLPFKDFFYDIKPFFRHTNPVLRIKAFEAAVRIPTREMVKIVLSSFTDKDNLIVERAKQYLINNLNQPAIKDEVLKEINNLDTLHLLKLSEVAVEKGEIEIFAAILHRIENIKDISVKNKILKNLRDLINTLTVKELLDDWKIILTKLEQMFFDEGIDKDVIMDIILKWGATGFVRCFSLLKNIKDKNQLLNLASNLIYYLRNVELKTYSEELMNSSLVEEQLLFVEVADKLLVERGELLDILTSYIKHPNSKIARKIVEVLIKHDYDKDIIKDAYMEDVMSSDAEDRIRAVEVISVLIDDEDVINILHRLIKDPDDSVRIKVVEILSTIPRAEVEAFLRHALNDPNIEVILAAINGLANFSTKATFQALMNFLIAVDSTLREAAALSLARIFIRLGRISANWFPISVSNMVRERVEEAYKNETALEMAASFEKLPTNYTSLVVNLITADNVTTSSIQGFISQFLLGEKSLSQLAISLVVYWALPEVKERFLHLLADDNPISNKVLELLMDKNKLLIPAFYTVVNNMNIPYETIIGLYKLKDDVARKFIEEKLSSAVEQDVKDALEILRYVPVDEFLDKLENLVNHPSEDIRLALVKVLKKEKELSQIKAILKKLENDSSEMVRIAVKRL